ncbi:MAG: alanine:cation symporter family protein, partial [Clostridiales bacterium]|nr:alanine:cation symporter family protein [Clostridiales bacterium]
MADTFNLFTAFLMIIMGVYMMCLCRFMPFRFASVLRGLFRLFRPKKEGKKGEISPFEAFAAALGGSVGTGNIAGVASAIAIGGPGAVFWMWVSGILGMATKYAEILIAMRFRSRGAEGTPVGGTMYCILKGMGKGAMPLAAAFSLFTLLASLGCGNTVQANTIAAAASEAAALFFPSVEWINALVGILTAAALAAVLFGGAKRICRASAYLVPLMSVLYIAASLAVIFAFRERLFSVFADILKGAFGFRPMLGGAAGFTLVHALRVGMVRGVFSNEAGIGAAPMAYASARSEENALQAMMGIFEVFVDTIVICTLTALMVLSSGIMIPYGDESASGMGIALSALSTVMQPKT